jgi:hypothetical protein
MSLAATSCATIGDSLKLGSSIGMATGAAGTWAGYAGSGHSPSMERIAIGAGIGMGIGLLASYLIHQDGEDRRLNDDALKTEMHFGDLPPSPFIMPKSPQKKGNR